MTNCREFPHILNTAFTLSDLMTLIDLLPFPAAVNNSNGECLYINKKWTGLTGLTNEEMIHLNWVRYIHPDDITTLVHYITEKKEGRVTFKLINKQQELMTLQGETNYIPHLAVSIAIINNITEESSKDQQILKQHRLLDLLHKTQTLFMTVGFQQNLFKELLSDVLDITESNYGFLAEVFQTGGKPYMVTTYLRSTSWDGPTAAIYEKYFENGVRFDNMNNLFGLAITQRQPLISNQPTTDPRKGGMPPGHFAIDCFLGLPVMYQDEVIGLIALANKPGGYTQADIDFLQPLVSAYSGMLRHHRLIQARDKNEDKLTRINNHLQSLVTSLDDIVFEIDDQLVFTNFWAKNEADLFMSPDNFLGKSIGDVFDKDFALAAKNTIGRVFETGKAEEIIYDDARPGNKSWYSGKFSLVESNDHKRIVLLVRNITHIKQAEDTLKDVQEKLLLTNQDLERTVELLEKSQHLTLIGGWEYFLDRKEFFFTKEMWNLFEMGDRAMSEIKPDYEFITPEFRTIVKTAFGKLLRNGTKVDKEIAYFTFKGRTFWGRTIAEPVYTGNRITSIKGAVIDVTGHKELRDEYIRARELAESASHAKTEFLSVMSHEIRTPMHAILGFVNLLLEDELSTKHQQYVNNMKYAAEQLLTLLNDILDYNKLEAGKVDIEHIPFSLNELVENATMSFLPKAMEKNIRLVCETDKNIPPMLVGDPFRLGQVISNLLSNAIKFTSQGYVKLNVEQLYTIDKQSAILFTIKDTGIGISQSKMGKIFESFTQEESSTTRMYGGSGLGLSISQKILSLFRSDIKVKSTKHKGSEFSFEIIFDHVDGKDDPGPTEPANERTLSGLRILLVEDNETNALIFSRFAQKWGAVVTHVFDGKSAVEQVYKATFDLILMDIQMPEMDGFQATAEIRKFNADIPIIALTADSLADTHVKVLKSGMDDLVVKPFDPVEFAVKLLRFSPK